MRRFLPLLLMLAGPLPAQDRPGDRRVVVTLQDGSRFSAPMSDLTVLVKTDHGELRIPFKDIQLIRRAGDREFLVRTARITVQGEIGQQEFEFDTEIGKLKVPLSEIKSMEAGVGLSLFVDDNTVALWSFDEARGDKIYDLVKERPLTLSDMEVTRDSSGVSALTRKNENAYAEAPGDDALEFPSGDFTIEARFKVGTTSRSYVTIISKNDKVNAQLRNYCLLVQNNGALYWDSLSNAVSYTSMTPQSVVKLSEWTYVALVIEPKNQTITYYVNGQPVHVARQMFQISPNDGPVFLGASPPAHSWSGPPEKLQFVRISKVARKAEEIAEWQKAMESGSSISWRSASKGIALRDGGFLRAEFPKLAGATFKTKFGSLRISENAAGQVAVYRFREHELAKVREEVKQLILQLGASKIDDREEAQLRLVKIGTPAMALLKENANDTDDEVRERIKAILKKFDETGVSRQPIGDVFRMGRTVLHGWLEIDRVDVATKYGTFEVSLRGVHTLNLGEAKLEGKQVMRLRSGETIQGEPPKGMTIEVETEFGKLKIPMKDVIGFTYDDAKKTWTVKTDRLTAVGRVSGDRIELETPAGSISVPMSEVAEFGLPGKAESPSPKKDPIIIEPDDDWRD